VAGGFTSFWEAIMNVQLEPIESVSLKDACVARLEAMILAGKFVPGERLPSERNLAAQLGVSRPVLHQAIVALDAKGLVQIEARRGVFVRDYRRDGSIALLNTLIEHSSGNYTPDLLGSLVAARSLIERETARLAAANAGQADIQELTALLQEGQSISRADSRALVDYDFRFHQQVAILSGNLMYPLLINSLKNVHTNLAGIFYREYAGSPVIDAVFAYHVDLVAAIGANQVEQAGDIMTAMLEHGEEHLLRRLPQE
jgi:DNA-binding FadR family transcriptional regulator